MIRSHPAKAFVLGLSAVTWSSFASGAPSAVTVNTPVATVQPSSSDTYLHGYLDMIEGDKLRKKRNFTGAFFKYRDARDTFDAVHAGDPTWNAVIVDYRRRKIRTMMDEVRNLEVERRAAGGDDSISGIPGSAPAPDAKNTAAPAVSGAIFDAMPNGSLSWILPGPSGDMTFLLFGSPLARRNASLSGMETVPSTDSGMAAWRMQYFQTPAATGDAADDADPDHDGLTNLTEFAFGLSPVDRTSNRLPEFSMDGPFFSASFTQPEGREKLTYSAEWSATMEPGSWAEIPDTGSGGSHVFQTAGDGARIFVRFVTKLR